MYYGGYSRYSPRGESYYIASFPGGKAAMGEKLLYNTGRKSVNNQSIYSSFSAYVLL
jgi:hypothetical protein